MATFGQIFGKLFNYVDEHIFHSNPYYQLKPEVRELEEWMQDQQLIFEECCPTCHKPISSHNAKSSFQSLYSGDIALKCEHCEQWCHSPL